MPVMLPYVFCVGAVVGRVFFFAVVGRVFFASNSSLIDVGAVACKVPKIVFGMVACGCGRFFVFACVFLVEKVMIFGKFHSPHSP